MSFFFRHLQFCGNWDASAAWVDVQGAMGVACLFHCWIVQAANRETTTDRQTYIQPTYLGGAPDSGLAQSRAALHLV